ncbi:MAG: methylenetetrahydrofolate reductase [NAD(P)H] [Clostridiales bacterium]|jgi:methylenetetrahydrofolate reductase (NADPH)|nr:methylenetetrahydrofolate reductase [NAD(P)H] [Clostridiales bacterium]
MYIKDILKTDKNTFSFEIFPPKVTSKIDSVLHTAQTLSKYQPDFISVTYGAGGGTSKNTAKIASFIENGCQIPALAHVTCVSSTKEEIATVLDHLKLMGIQNILALRGDIPEGKIEFPNPLHYKYATDLMKEIKTRGDFCIGGACYPEGHPESTSKEADIEHLKRKEDMGCDFLITQMFFDNEMFYRFIDKTQKYGLAIPAIPGIMPVINAKQIQRSCKLSGATLTRKFQRMIDKYQHNPDAMRQAGIAYATEQITDLFSNDVRGIHLYTMNNPDIAAAIKQNISYLY